MNKSYVDGKKMNNTVGKIKQIKESRFQNKIFIFFFIIFVLFYLVFEAGSSLLAYGKAVYHFLQCQNEY